MRKTLLTLGLFLWGTLVALGQSVKLPAEIKGPPGAFIPIAAETDCASLQWNVIDKPGALFMDLLPVGAGLNLFPMDLLKDTKTAVVTSFVPGRYRIQAYGVKDGKGSPIVECIVVVGTPIPPVPPTPIPPGPTPPGPDPPIPPTPDEAPIKEPGFRVLFIVDRLKLASLSSGQLDALYSAEVKKYTDSHCVMGPDGKTPEARWWNTEADTKNESPIWQKAFSRPREIGVQQTKSGDYKIYNRVTGLQFGLFARYEDAVRASGNVYPWVLISNGKTGYEGPIPTSEATMLELLKKYGG